MAKNGVSASAVGTHLDLTRQRVGQLADEGVFARLDDGSFKLDACRVAYIRWLRSDDRRVAKTATNSRINDARAAEIELRTAEREKRIVAEAQAHGIAIIEEFGGQLRSDLMAIPARVTADIAMRRRIEEQIEEAFGASSDRAKAEAARAQVPEPVAAEVRARVKIELRASKRSIRK